MIPSKQQNECINVHNLYGSNAWLLKTLPVSLQRYVGQVVIQLEGTALLRFSVSATKVGEKSCVISAYRQLDAVS